MGMTVHVWRRPLLRLFVMGFLVASVLFPALTYAQTDGPDQNTTTQEDTPPEEVAGATIDDKSWVGTIHNFAINIGGMFAGLGGVIFDLAIDQVVLKFGWWFKHGGIGGVVNTIWEMIRDMFNILFIFSLIYIGIKTILDSTETGTKKLLGGLIIAALLINFSLYVTKVIVDISNFTAIQVNSMASSKIEDSFINNFYTSSATDGGGSIAAGYMEVLRISSWFSAPVDTERILVFSMFSMFFLIILGFVLAYGGMMLIARFIALIFYMIFSPAMFLGWVLPSFKGIASKWWHGFLSYAFFAPAYIFMLYIGLYALQQMRQQLAPEGGAGFSEMFSGPFHAGAVQIFLFFAIGLGFLYASSKVAGIAAKAGAGTTMLTAHKMASRVGGYANGTRVAGALSFGLGSRALRNTAGQAGHRLSENESLKDYASRSRVGKSLLQGSRSLGSANFDPRKGKKGGYKENTAAIIKKEMDFKETLGVVGKNDPAMAAMLAEKDEVSKVLIQAQAELSHPDTTQERKAALQSEISLRQTDIEKRDVEIKKEKYRRQIGTQEEGTGEELTEIKEDKKQKELELHEMRLKFRTLEKKEKRKAAKKMNTLTSEIRKMQNMLKGQSQGYAGTLDRSGLGGVIKSAFYGRVMHQDQSAAEAIRTATQKDIKQTKSDKNLQALKDALAKST